MAKKSPQLDDFLPELEFQGPEVHRNVAVIEVAEPALLMELAADPKIGRFLVARLSETVALVDPGRVDDLNEALLGAGHTPKQIEGLK